MTEVELKEGQSAEPNKCGSCKFFKRNDVPETRTIRGGPQFEVDIWRGRCGWRPPPWLDRAAKETDGTFMNSREVLDTDSCDLYRTSGATFIQKRRWRVPQDTFGA